MTDKTKTMSENKEIQYPKFPVGTMVIIKGDYGNSKKHV